MKLGELKRLLNAFSDDWEIVIETGKEIRPVESCFIIHDDMIVISPFPEYKTGPKG